jgi:hypothetical protein
MGGDLLKLSAVVVVLVACGAPPPTPRQPPATTAESPEPPESPEPTSPPVTWEPCDPISDQEERGFVVEDPEAEGYALALETEHFQMWTAPGGEVVTEHVKFGEEHVKLMEYLLGHDLQRKIQFFVYPNLEAVRERTGTDFLIRRDALQLHLVESRRLREVVQLMTYDLAGHRSVPLFEEGFAEAHGDGALRPGDPPHKLAFKDWSDEHVHVVAAIAYGINLMPSLESVLEDRAFKARQWPRELPSHVYAASFATFVFDHYERPAFVEIIRTVCLEDDAATIKTKLEEAVGEDLETVEGLWFSLLVAIVRDKNRQPKDIWHKRLAPADP